MSKGTAGNSAPSAQPTGNDVLGWLRDQQATEVAQMPENSPYRLDENSVEQTVALLEGRRIVAAEIGNFGKPEGGWQEASGRLTLDDGTQVLVMPNDGGCSCGAGDYALEHLATVDNIITSVRLACESEDHRALAQAAG